MIDIGGTDESSCSYNALKCDATVGPGWAPGMQATNLSRPPERTPEMGKMVAETTDLAMRAKKVEESVCRIVDLLVGPLPNGPEGVRVDTQTSSARPRGILGAVECDLSSILRSLEQIEAAVGRL